MQVAVGPSDLHVRGAAKPFLAADIGGTYARVAVLCASGGGDGRLQVLAYRKFACREFASASELLQTFLARDARMPVRHGVLACAGQVLGDEVLQDNLAWPIRLSALRAALGFDDMSALNDFEALAHALDDPSARSGRLLCGPDVHPPAAGRESGPVLVIGPGTGLGAAVRLPGADGGTVLTTECGQMDFAPHTMRERDVLACLAPDGGYVAYERVTSGPGIATLYTTLCGLRGVAPQLATPEAVTAAALAGGDALAAEAVDIFCATLGSFAGGLAMAFLPTGGVYLGGGFLHAIFPLLARSAFAARFVHERSVRAFLSRVPVRVMEHGHHGVLGAANWYLRRADIAALCAPDRAPPAGRAG